MNDHDRIHHAVRSLDRIAPRRMPRWAAAKMMFGGSSTSSAALCRRFGLDPDEEIGPTERMLCSDGEVTEERREEVFDVAPPLEEQRHGSVVTPGWDETTAAASKNGEFRSGIVVGVTGDRRGARAAHLREFAEALNAIYATHLHCGARDKDDRQCLTDALCAQIAIELGVSVFYHPPNLEKYGSPAAYHIRNRKVVDACSVLFVFPGGRGTCTTRDYAIKTGVKLWPIGKGVKPKESE